MHEKPISAIFPSSKANVFESRLGHNPIRVPGRAGITTQMKLLVNIDQKGSIRAGYDAPNSTEMTEIQVSQIPEDLRSWFSDSYDIKTGEVKVSARRGAGWSSANGDWDGRLILTQPVTTERIVDALRKLHTEHAAHLADVAQRLKDDVAREVEAFQKAIAAGPVVKTDWVRYGETRVEYGYDAYDLPSCTFHETCKLRDEIPEVRRPFQAARNEALARARELEAAREATLRADERAIIPRNELSRYDEGLMSKEEIRGYIRRQIELPAGQTDYVPLCESDIEHSDECPGEGCEIEYDVDPAPSATRKQWSQLRLVRKTHPDAKLMRHAGKFACDDGWTFKYSIRVTGLQGVYRDFACE